MGEHMPRPCYAIPALSPYMEIAVSVCLRPFYAHNKEMLSAAEVTFQRLERACIWHFSGTSVVSKKALSQRTFTLALFHSWQIRHANEMYTEKSGQVKSSVRRSDVIYHIYTILYMLSGKNILTNFHWFNIIITLT